MIPINVFSKKGYCKGNIYVRDIPSKGICKVECIIVKKIETELQDEVETVSGITIRAGLSDFDDTIKDAYLFTSIAKPYNLHYLLLRSLGFQYENNSYTKTCLLKNDSRFIKLDVLDNRFRIDKNTIDKSMHNLIHDITSLHELQNQVRELFQFELYVDVRKCNHILCLLAELQAFIEIIEHKITGTTYCCYIKQLPKLLQTSQYFEMPQSDVDLIVGYMCDIKGYSIKVDLNGCAYICKYES
ncbi:MAG: hypothetical protein MJ003_05095 [Paludibacteraceae bacterium]|nr:hypothetical protein [Paludibacteraceae bacterium]